jgi:hypothetical protein
MDQELFRRTYRDMNERVCIFEKGTLAGKCRCSRAERFCLAEREGVHCRSDEAQERCGELIGLLRHHARFTLKTNDETGALPHGKAMRIQIGGLNGVHAAVHDTDTPPLLIGDVDALLESAIVRFGSLRELPFQVVIKHIAAYRGRKKRFER